MHIFFSWQTTQGIQFLIFFIFYFSSFVLYEADYFVVGYST